ncbi:MAG: decarboxylating 6-phosphogluconate dehydrogenase [Candidatus Taylorbacteria bacterium]|nr:decarboxylating 6-phosphogluconate dehydrogenase [Candidatus Taylorbacteria bacterium]
MKLGYIGLGKMGKNMVLRMREKGVDVVAYNRSEAPRTEAKKVGIAVVDSIGALVGNLQKPRTVWVMVSNNGVDETLDELIKHLDRGDTVIDGGNSMYKDSVRRAVELEKKGIDFLDAGVSGGPKGARDGACIMVGGKKKVYEKYENLFEDLSASGAFAYMGKSGAGHFVKMVHNGIEYGMMQAVAEGFAVMRASDFKLDLEKVANLYNHKSVVESRLVGWLSAGYEKYGTDLEEISGTVAHTGEGEWTVKAAKELGVAVPIIESSFKFRVMSEKNPSYAGKVLSTLRNQFGGHDAVTKSKPKNK